MSGHGDSPADDDRLGRGAPVEHERSTGRPRAVLLDFHNTTAVVGSMENWIAEAGSRVASRPASTSVAVGRIRTVWGDARELFPTLDWDLDAAAHRHAFVSTVTRGEAMPLDFAEALYETMPNQWVLNDGARDFIVRASGAGIRLAIVSNIALDIRPALAGWGIASALDAVVLSYEVGSVKPDPRIFQLAAGRLDSDPRECLMIGDSAHDDAGGAALGMPCLIARPDQMWRAFELVCPR
ncbi:HAD superfamily hydrolase (TIGR01509 family)/HAD superfamily hydrolase (TIGR01549 family) [Frondihabitans sp. PhB188]|uniref:HAD family hydrolase n=1 Tax=Frondihabitans sp. PhB188 TaxID=2485200 RepID=UPI000F47C617|nr:HAD family hydrolase [Frondihabitans sp. PhB188]ROQ38371.1 HAD superfamily hydrolase (TIGR01509 family)/HAD superfamily hydrolase (TIGR01549 family) [Frondihabitans sp. PhB188]